MRSPPGFDGWRAETKNFLVAENFDQQSKLSMSISPHALLGSNPAINGEGILTQTSSDVREEKGG
jgi:hypothetical protein